MESDFKVVHKAAMKKNLEPMISSAFSPGDKLSSLYNHQIGGASTNDDDISEEIDEEEHEQFRRREVKKLFDLVDKDGSGYIDRRELETLMKSMRSNLTQNEVTEGFARVDVDLSGRIEFNEFYKWYKIVY